MNGHAFAPLQSLTEGIHTKEALDLVREHVRGIMGPAAVAFSNAMIKMSRLQAAQVCRLSCYRHCVRFWQKACCLKFLSDMFLQEVKLLPA